MGGIDLIIKVDQRGVAQIKKLPDAAGVVILQASPGQREHAAGSSVLMVCSIVALRRSRGALKCKTPTSLATPSPMTDLKRAANQVVAIIRSERSRRSREVHRGRINPPPGSYWLSNIPPRLRPH